MPSQTHSPSGPIRLALSLLVLGSSPLCYSKDTHTTFFSNLKPALSQKCPRNAQTTLLYFASIDCPYAKQLTPKLLTWYTQKTHETIEIVFISNDLSETIMKQHILSPPMPWSILKYDCRSYTPIRRLSTGETQLVAVDSSGKKLFEVHPTDPLESLDKQLLLLTTQKAPHQSALQNDPLPKSPLPPIQPLLNALELLQHVQTPK